MYYGKKVTTDFKPEKTEKKAPKPLKRSAIKKKQIKCNCCGEFFDQKIIGVKYCLAKDECVKAWRDKNAADQKKANEKKWKSEKAVLKIDVYAKENKTYLQREINKLARLIDAKFGYNSCICCGRAYGKQTDGAHFHSIGSNSSLRFNLHNIHSASSYCNDYSNTHISGYKIGLEKRYGKEYATMIIEELPLKYKEIKLSNLEISQKLKMVRSINKNFSTFKFDNVGSEQERNLFNNLIGIYTNTF